MSQEHGCIVLRHFVICNHHGAETMTDKLCKHLAEWIVDITTEADRQGSDKFVDTYKT